MGEGKLSNKMRNWGNRGRRRFILKDEQDYFLEFISEAEALERRLAEADALCVKLALQKGGQVDEMRDLKARLIEADRLLVKHYPCYSETNCKKCVGDWDKIHYETCPGYNVLKILRGEVGESA